jgi:hypothetical protein
MIKQTEEKIIEGFRIIKDGWTYVLVNGGMGGFLNPPGDLEHIAHIAMSRYGVPGPNSDTISLRGVFADWASYIPQEVKDAVAKLLSENPGDCKDEAWIRSIYNYFQNGYSKDGVNRNVNDRENVYFVNPVKHPIVAISLASEAAEKSLAYLFIREFDPEHTPRKELLFRNWYELPAIDGEMWAKRPQPKQTEGE